MHKSTRSNEATIRYLTNRLNMERFAFKLREYIRGQLKHTVDEHGDDRWDCKTRRSGSQAQDYRKYFKRFCKMNRLDPVAVSNMFWIGYQFWFHCDCEIANGVLFDDKDKMRFRLLLLNPDKHNQISTSIKSK